MYDQGEASNIYNFRWEALGVLAENQSHSDVIPSKVEGVAGCGGHAIIKWLQLQFIILEVSTRAFRLPCSAPKGIRSYNEISPTGAIIGIPRDAPSWQYT